ncbi:M50 family metallopeptidase [Botrimarina mediterranea]|uniref:Peptidase family M50 n=1 Tax=Botrimarina mediterranea TaxID=2528022 RepID=A0A518KAC4_9BACT|nr:M50 family metallopeptidase [Botrimarina mediterranea]QDV74738.1 hypothetical protein Spa11_29460 [Botrimarina mediterranea]
MNAGGPATVAALIAVAIWMWLAMLLTHELGHVVAAMFTGGKIMAVELRPGWLPHTLVDPNPRPSVVLWSGFLSGWIAPQMTAPAWRIRAGFVGPVLRAWAAFCLLAGGVYLAAGGAERLTDTGQFLANGWSHALLILIGATVAALGYGRSRAAWIALAKDVEAKPITRRAAIAWWCWLAAWAAGQGMLHTTVQPSQ